MKNICYERLIFNEEDRSLLIRLRTRTVNGIKADFKGLYRETFCPLGCGETDTLENVLRCKTIIIKLQNNTTM